MLLAQGHIIKNSRGQCSKSSLIKDKAQASHHYDKKSPKSPYSKCSVFGSNLCCQFFWVIILKYDEGFFIALILLKVPCITL